MRLFLLLVLAASGVLTAFSASNPPQSVSQAMPPHAEVSSFLPPNPEDWVCRPTPPTKSEIDALCAQPRGDALPDALRHPPSVADFQNYNDYNKRMRAYLQTRQYKNWIADARWRLSGPSVTPPATFGHNYGTHFPLRVYYSPEVVEWLCNERQGEIPDGAMIVKEMTVFSLGDLPLVKTNVDQNSCMTLDQMSTLGGPIAPLVWAPMVKSSKSSHDGWVWIFQQLDNGFPPPPQLPPPLADASAFTTENIPTAPAVDDPNWYPTGSQLENVFKTPNVVMLSGFAGMPACLACHAAAKTELTFASIDNILGRELRYKEFKTGPATGQVTPKNLSPFPKRRDAPTPAFLAFFDQLQPVNFTDVWPLRMPAETYDQQVVSAHKGPGQFLTAAQCNACHNASPQIPLLPNMSFVADEVGRSSRLRNLSPYGEWRVSPMGLAGRDPVFFSQLQSETNVRPELKTCIEQTCLHCHAVMGQRQLAIDTKDTHEATCRDMFAIAPPRDVPFGAPLLRSALQQWPGSTPSDLQFYGALGRDGISCTVCHHVADEKLGDESTFTGNFVTGKANEVYGPYKDNTIVTKPMENALGITPKLGDQISKSELCGSCHNVLLPVFDNSGNLLGSRYEQSTHLEWLNSDSGRPGPQFQSCQDCHMPTRYKGKDLHFKIANSQSAENFPPTAHRLPDKDINLTQRTKYSRHALHGLNAFLNQFFQQFPLILGFQQVDWVSTQGPIDSPAPPSGSNYVQELPLFTGFESILDMARNQTATVDIGPVKKTPKGELRTEVTVTNLTGHTLPTGVGFRRMFLQFLVLDQQGNTLWASGRTNELGFILDGMTDNVLDSEQPVRFPNAPIQPHYQVIKSGNQVQIYQEVTTDSQGFLTTSFLKRVEIVKNNRIRPKGFDPRYFAKSPSAYIRDLAELPPDEAEDPYYTDRKRTGAHKIEYRIPLDRATLGRAAKVEVTLFYQSIPPFYLQQRFRDASQGAAEKDDIRRLYYIASHLNLDAAASEKGEAALKGWKLQLATKEQSIK